MLKCLGCDKEFIEGEIFVSLTIEKLTQQEKGFLSGFKADKLFNGNFICLECCIKKLREV